MGNAYGQAIFSTIIRDKNGYRPLAPPEVEPNFCGNAAEKRRDAAGAELEILGNMPGGRIYLEWPSLASTTFPLRGFGLNFYDDPTHVRTFAVDEIAEAVRARGFTVERAGYRRLLLRALLSPALVVLHSLRLRRFVLYDCWDLTGFCYVVVAVRDISPTERK